MTFQGKLSNYEQKITKMSAINPSGKIGTKVDWLLTSSFIQEKKENSDPYQVIVKTNVITDFNHHIKSVFESYNLTCILCFLTEDCVYRWMTL